MFGLEFDLRWLLHWSDLDTIEGPLESAVSHMKVKQLNLPLAQLAMQSIRYLIVSLEPLKAAR